MNEDSPNNFSHCHDALTAQVQKSKQPLTESFDSMRQNESFLPKLLFSDIFVKIFKCNHHTEHTDSYDSGAARGDSYRTVYRLIIHEQNK